MREQEIEGKSSVAVKEIRDGGREGSCGGFSATEKMSLEGGWVRGGRFSVIQSRPK